MAGRARQSCKFVAVLSSNEAAIHNLSDHDGLSRRILSANATSVIATSCFRTQGDARSWVTDSIKTDAVLSADALTTPADPPAGWTSTDWLVVVSRSSGASFELHSAGLASGLALITEESVGTCILRRFSSSPQSWSWLASGAGQALLGIVSCSAAVADRVRGLCASPARPGAAVPCPSLETPSSELSLVSVTHAGSHASACSASVGFQSRRSSRARPSTPSSRSLFGKRSSTPSRCERVVPEAGGAGVGMHSAFYQAVDEALGALEDGHRPVRRQRMKVNASVAPSWNPRRRPSSLSARLGAASASSSACVPAPPSPRPPLSSRLDLHGIGQRRSFVDGPILQWSGEVAALAPPAPSRAAAPARPASIPAGDELCAVPQGAIGLLAAQGKWDEVSERLWARCSSAFITGGPGAGKSTLLRHMHAHLRRHFPGDGEVVVVAPTGTSAKTAGGMTYHSFFGFVRDYEAANANPTREAATLLATSRFQPIKQRLAKVRALLLDEVSMVGADKLGIMYELLSQARGSSSPPCLWFAFGDFLQLGPVKSPMAFTSLRWPKLFGNEVLDLTGQFRQADSDFIRAVADALVGKCTDAVRRLISACWVDGTKYEEIKNKVFHLMPHHRAVIKHNRECLNLLSGGRLPEPFRAVDRVVLDPDRDFNVSPEEPDTVSEQTLRAALHDCVAPVTVPHCLHARVKIINNRKQALGICHGSIGEIVSYEPDGTPVVRLENHALPAGVESGAFGLRDAGQTWVEVLCPPVPFTARLLAHPGLQAVRTQLPFVLGWADTIHMSQSLSVSEAVLDLAECFEPGMVNTAISRVPDKASLFIKSFSPSRIIADPLSLAKYRGWKGL